MTKGELIAAILSPICAVIVALIGLITAVINKKKKQEQQKEISIEQHAEGHDNVQIGFYNNNTKEENHD